MAAFLNRESRVPVRRRPSRFALRRDPQSTIHRPLLLRLALPLALLLLAGCRAGTARPLYEWSEADVTAALTAARHHPATPAERAVDFGRRALGQPYEIYLLGEFPFEGHDPDPLYCLSKSDCLTFCEHIYALALADDWWGFLANLQRIRYDRGAVGMITRNHYTVAEWNRHNAFILEDLTTTLGGGEASVTLEQTLRRARFFRQFGIGQDIPDVPITDAYIPTARVPAVLDELRTGDFVNIVRGNDAAQYCGHTGLIARAPDGTVNFLHSARPRVREQPLVDYLARDGSLGIKILRLRPDAGARMRAAVAEPDVTPISAQSLAAAVAEWPLYRGEPPPSYARDWKAAMKLQAYRLDYDTPADAELQRALEAADERIRAELGLTAEQRAFGVLDLSDRRYAAIAPDQIFYGASVPKICIVAAWLEQHPEQVAELAPQIRRELELVLKRSDNELAARYSQLVGLDALQEWIQSKRYGFYDAEQGGGLWCGKHYGLAEPRIGEPLADHSHAVTVRQCLRYYLMLEQGRLVSTAASTLLKELFAAPTLDFHADNFVRGLQGRDVTLIRKSGWWEDWHLDTARVQHGARVYLLAGATEHPRGTDYLAAMAAAIDDYLCGPPAPPPYAHHHQRFDDPVTIAAEHRSPELTLPLHFNEALLSWNVDVPAGAGACLELRVQQSWDGEWSPWLYLCEWGDAGALRSDTRRFDAGRIRVDYFVSDRRFDRLQYRVRTTGPAVTLRRIDVTVSDTTGLPVAHRHRATAEPANVPFTGTLDVPFRSQKTENRDISGRICSPTSLAMVMEYRGVSQPTIAVAEAAYDDLAGIYGNWPRNVQTAYALGVPGGLTRVSDWDTVARYLAAGQPLIASIRVREAGGLRGAPYRRTDGHLIVITGLDADGGVTVNDPAVADPATGRRTYSRADLEQAWFRGSGGVAYVLEAPGQ